MKNDHPPTDDKELQRLKQRATEERKKSKRKWTKADAEYAEALIRKGFFESASSSLKKDEEKEPEKPEEKAERKLKNFLYLVGIFLLSGVYYFSFFREVGFNWFSIAVPTFIQIVPGLILLRKFKIEQKIGRKTFVDTDDPSNIALAFVPVIGLGILISWIGSSVLSAIKHTNRL